MGENWLSHSYCNVEYFAVVVPKKDGLPASLCTYQNKNTQPPQNPVFVVFPEKIAVKTSGGSCNYK